MREKKGHCQGLCSERLGSRQIQIQFDKRSPLSTILNSPCVTRAHRPPSQSTHSKSAREHTITRTVPYLSLSLFS